MCWVKMEHTVYLIAIFTTFCLVTLVGNLNLAMMAMMPNTIIITVSPLAIEI